MAAFCAASIARDVRRRVGLGVAELGGRGRARPRDCAEGIHPVEDEVRRAVDDAEDALDAVAGEASRSGRMIGIAPATAAS